MRAFLLALESLVLLAVRFALGGLFIFAAWQKIGQAPTDNPLNDRPYLFSVSVKAFEILPDHLATLATFTIPWAEAIVGVLVILGFWARSAALVLATTLIAFIAGIFSVIQRGLNVDCGCFGDYSLLCPDSTLGWCHIGQNSLLLLAALAVLVRGAGFVSVDWLAQRGERREARNARARQRKRPVSAVPPPPPEPPRAGPPRTPREEGPSTHGGVFTPVEPDGDRP